MKYLLPFLLLLAVVIGCNNTKPSNSVALDQTPNNTPSATPTPRTFEMTTVGQAARILDEGRDDAAISKNIAEADKSISYEMLKKNADKYAGQAWAFSGKILEITETEGNTLARISLDDWGNKAVFVIGSFETPFVEKDRVYVVGYLANSYSYTSQANWQITIPSLAARAIMKPDEVAKYRHKTK